MTHKAYLRVHLNITQSPPTFIGASVSSHRSGSECRHLGKTYDWDVLETEGSTYEEALAQITRYLTESEAHMRLYGWVTPLLFDYSLKELGIDPQTISVDAKPETL